MQRMVMVKSRLICGIAILLLMLSINTTSLAENDEFRARDGNGWSITTDGVLTIESNNGWQDYLRNGSNEVINKLVIGKKLTEFYLFDCNTQEYINSDIECPWLQPKQIEVEEGNPVFIVEKGLLINTKSNTVTLSELWVKDVVIPEGIQTIGAYAFFRRSIEKIQFSSTVVKIEAFSFSDCENLKALMFPSMLNRIDENAFSGCTSVSEVQFSNNLEFIGNAAFDYCPIRKLILPDSVHEIGSQAFRGCDKLEIVQLPAQLEEIGYRLFYDCTNLTDIKLPEGLKYIGVEAFSGCKWSDQLTLPASLQEIGAGAFRDLDFDLVEFPSALKVGESAFGRIHVAVLTGSDYEFSYGSIFHVDDLLFLNTPPIGILMDSISTSRLQVYYTEPYAGAWKPIAEAGLNGWPTQCISVEEAQTRIAQAGVPTPQPTSTPEATTEVLGMHISTPEPYTQPDQPAADTKTDPLVYVLAGLLVFVAAGIVVIGVKTRKRKRAGSRHTEKP